MQWRPVDVRWLADDLRKLNYDAAGPSAYWWQVARRLVDARRHGLHFLGRSCELHAYDSAGELMDAWGWFFLSDDGQEMLAFIFDQEQVRHILLKDDIPPLPEELRVPLMQAERKLRRTLRSIS